MGSIIRLFTGEKSDEEKKFVEKTPPLEAIKTTETLAAEARTQAAENESEQERVRRRRSRTRLTKGKGRGVLGSSGGQGSGLGRVLS